MRADIFQLIYQEQELFERKCINNNNTSCVPSSVRGLRNVKIIDIVRYKEDSMKEKKKYVYNNFLKGRLGEISGQQSSIEMDPRDP